jgi:hypothetical protein
VTAYPHEKLRVTVLSVRSEFETKRLKDIETISETIVPTPDEKERIRAQMQKVTEDMTRSIEPRCLPL